jgi:hypothetical protein
MATRKSSSTADSNGSETNVSAQYANVNPDKGKILKQYLIEKGFAVKLRQVKIYNWLKNEEGYNGVTQKTLMTRANLHMPIIFEGVQNMAAKIGVAPEVKFDTIPEGDENAAPLMEHIVSEDLDDSDFEQIYDDSKIECGIYGRTIYKVIPGNDKNRVELVDTLAFLISPIARGSKKALYAGQQFIYKTNDELKEEKNLMEYDEEELQRLKENKVPKDTQTDDSSEASVKNMRFANMGLSNTTQYGSKVAELTEWWTYLKLKGDKKKVLYALTVANDQYLLRCVRGTDLGCHRLPFFSWGVFTRGITFWCPSVADVYRDPNLAVDLIWGMLFVASDSGLKQSSIVPRPLGVTPVTVGLKGRVQDKVWQFSPTPIENDGTADAVKGYADTAAGLAPNLPKSGGSKGKLSVTQQAAAAAQLDEKIAKAKRNATACFKEMTQFMSDVTAERLTKPRKVKLFGYKNLTIEDVTKKNFNGVTLKSTPRNTDDTQNNKAIKQKAKLQIYEVFKDDKLIPGQLALRRSVAKSFDIDPDEIESWFSEDKEASGMNAAAMGAQPAPQAPNQPPAPSAPPQAVPNAPAPTDATPLLSQTASTAAAAVPPTL